MADDTMSPGARNISYPPLSGTKRIVGNDQRALNRSSMASNPGSNPLNSPVEYRRRSSNLSDYSMNEARRQFQSSTEDLLLPNVSRDGQDESRAPSHWHSAPLAFALLPALGGMLFKNGSSVVTDAMILGLAAIFLNWSVRIPWDWYHSAQEVRIREEEVEQVDDIQVSSSQVLEDVPEEDNEQDPIASTPRRSSGGISAQKSAANELYVHELLALVSCFVFPVLGAWLLHALRSALSRPSEGLVSNFNLTIFLFASEIRPVRHLVKLVQARTLRLQKIVNAHAGVAVSSSSIEQLAELKVRLENLETVKLSTTSQINGATAIEPQLTAKQITTMSTEVRRTLQPELDSLNRAVRRYEKRLATQTMQTEARILDLEARLSDAITLAAAAAQNRSQSRRGLGSLMVEWATFAIVFPLQLATLPLRILNTFVIFLKNSILGAPPSYPKKKATNGRYVNYANVRIASERLPSKGLKR